MDVVDVVSSAIGICADTVCLLVETLLWTLAWLSRLLSHVSSALHTVLHFLSSLLHYWDLALLSFLKMMEAVSSAARGALHTLEGWLQTLGGVLESFKMVGHLFCHVGWRVKEWLQRGIVSGNLILRQLSDGLFIALSLILYLINTAVNVVLIGMHNCFSVMGGAWEAVAAPLHKALDLALTLQTCLYSCLGAISMLVWTPCQMLLNLLEALGHVFITAFLLDANGLLLTALIVSLALLYLNPRLPLLAVRQSFRLAGLLQGVHILQTALHRLYTVFVEPVLIHAESPQDVGGTRLLYGDAGASLGSTDIGLNSPGQVESPQLHSVPVGEPQSSGGNVNNSSSRTVGYGLNHLTTAEETDGSADASHPTDRELLSLLKEQEERKKCVICQDSLKTVLLLPCRHLCLCRPCSDVLTLRRPLQQRCCPLCRRTITNTMDVYL